MWGDVLPLPTAGRHDHRGGLSVGRTGSEPVITATGAGNCGRLGRGGRVGREGRLGLFGRLVANDSKMKVSRR